MSDHLLEVGRVAKAHGLRGEVLVVLVTDRPERIAPGSVLSTDERELVVGSSRPHGKGHLVTFDGVTGREAAEALRGTVLRAEPIDDPDELWVHELVGSELRTVDGRSRGQVRAVVANPAADLLELDDGTLVPVVFVVDGPRAGVVVVDTPDGLFELGG